MARVKYLPEFSRTTEKAFTFYKTVFGGEFSGEINRLGDTPQTKGMPKLPQKDKDLIMHIELPILGGHVLMGTDAPESLGFKVNAGNNVHLMLEPDSKEETDRLFKALSRGGKITMKLQTMFWGAYYGSCTDKFGVQWMFNYTSAK